MKSLGMVFVLSLTLFAVSCGNKNESGGSSSKKLASNPYQVQTVVGTVDLNPQGERGQYFTYKKVKYQIVDNQGVMFNAWNAGKSSGIIVDSINVYKVTMSGFFNNGQVVNQQYPSQFPQPQTGVPSVQVQSAVFAR